MRGGGFAEREDPVDDRLRGPARDEVVDAREVGSRPHRRAEDGELLPPDAMELGRRVRPAGRSADDDPPFGRRRLQRGLPGRLAHVLDDDVGAVTLGRFLHGRRHVAGLVVHDRVGAELARPLELLVARRGRDHAAAESLREHERRRGDAAAGAPDEHPLALLEFRARDQHPVGGLEDEREGGGLLEGEVAREGDGRSLRGRR